MLDLEYNKNLFFHIQSNLKRFEYISNNSTKLTRASVAITIVSFEYSDFNEFSSCSKNEASIILTRRSLKLKNHPGQWALPGGKIDENETPEDAAIRELKEEIDLSLDKSSILGRLDDYATRSGFIMQPVVFWGGKSIKLTPNPDEVHSIHFIPISEFMRNDAPILQSNPHSNNPILFMPLGDSFIGAPTAAILYQFREVAVSGNFIRVSHYEQPYFAWS